MEKGPAESFESFGSKIAMEKGPAESFESFGSKIAMEKGPAESCESFGREVALMFDELSSAPPGDFLCFSWMNEMMEAFTVADVSFRIILDEYKPEFMKWPLDIMFANYLRCCDEGHRLSFSIIHEDSFPLIEEKIKMLHSVEDDVKGVSNLRKGIHDQMMKGADYAAGQSRYRSASLSLEYIQNLIIRPTSQEILASNGLVRVVFTMECVSYIALWLLVVALPCYGRSLKPSFEFPRQDDLDYPWAMSFTRVKQRVLELRSDDGLVQEYSKMKQRALELLSLNAEQKLSVAAEFCIAAQNLRTAFGPFKLRVEDFHSRLKKWCNEYKEILDTAPIMNPSAGAPVPSSSSSNLCAELESVVCALFASLSSEELMSVDWVTKVQDIFAACMKHLLLIISLNQPQCSEFPIDKVFDKYFENCVAPALDIMNASLQGITKIRECLMLSDIVLIALSGNTLQLIRARRALEKLSSVMNNQSETIKLSASKTLQSIADSLPRKREFPCNIELENTFLTMRFVSLSAMWALVAAVPCPGRGLLIRVKFPDKKDFPWADHMCILRQHIIEAQKRSNSSGLRLGLLKETQHWESCMQDLKASIDDSASSMSEELKARISDQVAVLNTTTQSLKIVLDELEKVIESIFREATSFVRQGQNIKRPSPCVLLA